jgi:hypothetical protein
MPSGNRTVWTQHDYDTFLKTTKVPQPAIARTVTAPGKQKVTTGRTARKPGQKTTVEIAFEARLKADWPQMDILYEAVKVKIDDTCWFLPDYFIPQLLTFFEVKGNYIYPDALIKFKAARALHPWAVWQMHQSKGGVWTRLY